MIKNEIDLQIGMYKLFEALDFFELFEESEIESLLKTCLHKCSDRTGSHKSLQLPDYIAKITGQKLAKVIDLP